MGKGTVKWGGLAKAAIYLRYSQGFLQWLEGIDGEAADRLRCECGEFERLFQGGDVSKARLHQGWLKKVKTDRSISWRLPIVCHLADGRCIVLGLEKGWDGQLDDALAEELDQVALQESLQLARQFRTPPEQSRELIQAELHARTGMGRNAFGLAPKMTDMPESEYVRLLGPELVSTRKEVLAAWNQRLAYPVSVAPNPKGTRLLFFPQEGLSFGVLRAVVEYEREKRDRFFEERKNAAKRKKTAMPEDERPAVIAEIPNYVPGVDSSTVVMINLERGTKTKLAVLGVFPSVNLGRWSLLNSELLEFSIEYHLVSYCRAAITGHEKSGGGDPPSVYSYWTTVFTSALQNEFVSMLPAWHMFQRYCKAHTSDALVRASATSVGAARAYLRLLRRFRRLQHMIGTCRSGLPDPDALSSELTRVESLDLICYGVIDPMNTSPPPTAAPYLEDIYEELWDRQKYKIDQFVRQSWQGTPEAAYPSFIRGALVGILLNELEWAVQCEDRRFEATQGRHPTTLRGDILPGVFSKGIGLLQNLGAERRFNCRLLPFLARCVPESRTVAFNNGLIMGMAYRAPTRNDEKENGTVTPASTPQQ